MRTLMQLILIEICLINIQIIMILGKCGYNSWSNPYPDCQKCDSFYLINLYNKKAWNKKYSLLDVFRLWLQWVYRY